MTPPPPAKQQWTVLGLVEWTADHLASKGFDEARLTVELILAHVLHLRRLDLYLQFDRPLAAGELAAFRALYERRLTHEPLQYILGQTEFMGLKLIVDRSVLIPRPESEELVEQAAAAAGRLGSTSLAVLDIGTGSGNVALALARMLPASRITSVDISRAALELARRNAEANGIANVTFLEADIFGTGLDGNAFDLIVSNPPYVSAREFAGVQPEIRDFEPHGAVTDGADGYRFHTRIAVVARTLLSHGGTVVVEVGYDQAERVRELFEQEGLMDVSIRSDVAGIKRLVSASRP